MSFFQDTLLSVSARVSESTVAQRALLAGVAVIAVAVAGPLFLRSRDFTGPPNLMCVTPGCNYRNHRSLEIGQVLPLQCPTCGKRSVYTTHVCRACGAATVLNRQRGLQIPTYCPKCGNEVTRGN